MGYTLDLSRVRRHVVNPESGFDSGFLHLTAFKATLLLHPESGFDSGFLHLTAFSATLLLNPESGFDSGFLHLTAFKATLLLNPESGFNSGLADHEKHELHEINSVLSLAAFFLPWSGFCSTGAARQSPTRGKANQKELWRYCAMARGFYVFKHEYIFVFKKWGGAECILFNL
jgi:hypothetical protein